jgi:plastocyanin
MKSKTHWIRVGVAAMAVAVTMLSSNRASSAPTIAASAPTTGPAVSQPLTIEIDNFNFKPRELTVNAGSTVKWINHDDVPHTATARGKSPVFDSKMLDTDDRFSFTFRNPGTYSYYCKVHPHMTATIVVK